jgi:hypothetical protein
MIRQLMQRYINSFTDGAKTIFINPLKLNELNSFMYILEANLEGQMREIENRKTKHGA